METIQEETEISLIDLLLVIFDNIKLLVLGPLLVGFIALGMAFFLPKSYVSSAIVMLPTTANMTPAQAAAIMASPRVLDPIIRDRKLEADSSVEEARTKLAQDVKATVGKDTLLKVEASGATPAEAQALLNDVIDGWLKSTVPGDRDRQDLEKRLTYAQASLTAATKLLERLSAGGSDLLNKPLTFGQAGTSLTATGELQARYLNDVVNITRSLEGIARDVIVQKPTLPTKPSKPKKALIAILFTVGAGFALLLFVFVRHAVRQSANDSATASKWAQLNSSLRRALGRAAG